MPLKQVHTQVEMAKQKTHIHVYTHTHTQCICTVNNEMFSASIQIAVELTCLEKKKCKSVFQARLSLRLSLCL